MKAAQQKLEQNNTKLTAGEIAPEKWADKFDQILYEGHFKALELGYQRSGNFDYDPDELKTLARGIKDTESEFLDKFLADVKSGSDPRYFDEEGNFREGSLDDRSDLYVGRMRGTANEAFVDASPEEAEFTWNDTGGPGECSDCQEMAAMSPYAKDTILSFPGDGSTACLGECNCTLTRDDGVECFGHHNGDDSSEEQDLEDAA